ncbi:MAG TPA: arabinan endo-1,5-alpha-L-arabinosidase [Flavisolibacter sp.]|jgi:arabinan endo-1,5-alpha-L-arabinosidase|nr:arabinan endo-1,5-alpha-L-arabinosidase [Flavisolibacter sp.]
MRILFCILAFYLVQTGKAQLVPVGAIFTTEQTPMHDPVIIKQDSMYYIFSTGNGISVWSSKNRGQWKKEAPVFAHPPQWAVDAVPGFKGHIWAPDIQYFDGKYYLFYSVSQFGKNTSCIGVAVNKTLHPSSPDYAWRDLGKVVQSVPGRDLWNAIDPNMITDETGTPWLSFGSWWTGIKLVKLDSNMKMAEPQQWYSLARRPRNYNSADAAGSSAAIEAPFIFKKGDYYYLFVSFDLCCKGEQSTYKMVVGRSRKLQGPYLDKAGLRMDSNGGSLLLEGNADWHGVGHNAVYTVDGKDLLVFHGYDAKDKGRSKLRIEELVWDSEGWPVVK